MVGCIIGSWDAILKISTQGVLWTVGRGNDISHHPIRDIDLSIIAMICSNIFYVKDKVFSCSKKQNYKINKIKFKILIIDSLKS